MKLFGLMLRANSDARRDYARMTADAAYRTPRTYDAIDTVEFDGLLLPGGHCARGIPRIATGSNSASIRTLSKTHLKVRLRKA